MIYCCPSVLKDGPYLDLNFEGRKFPPFNEVTTVSRERHNIMEGLVSKSVRVFQFSFIDRIRQINPKVFCNYIRYRVNIFLIITNNARTSQIRYLTQRVNIILPITLHFFNETIDIFSPLLDIKVIDAVAF